LFAFNSVCKDNKSFANHTHIYKKDFKKKCGKATFSGLPCHV